MAKQAHMNQKSKGGNAKRPAAYRAFVTQEQAQRTDLHSMSAKERARVLGEEWQKLSAQEQQTYHGKAPGKHKTRGKSHAGGHTKRPSRAKRAGKKTTKRGATRKGAQAHEAADHSHE